MTYMLKLKANQLPVAERAADPDDAETTTRFLGNLEFPVEVDVKALLAEHREIAVVWATEDVRQVRPDLTDDQAWVVLRQVYLNHDCELGITWLTLEDAADDLFGPAPDEAEEAVAGHE